MVATVCIYGVGHEYADGTVGVSNVDLTVHDGEFFVLVGPSGCGKTTLLRMIAGLETPSRGCIEVDGVDIAGVPTEHRSVGMLFQTGALYPHLSVRENLAFPLTVVKTDPAEIEARVDVAARMVNVASLLELRPARLSGGQRQRVAMGRAIVRDPDLLLMDEPMSNLDAKLRVELRSRLLNLHHQMGTTTIYVTHDQIEAMSLGDRVAVMRHGQVVQHGTPAGIYHTPADVFVAGFFGVPAMNIVAGVVDRAHGGGLAVRVGTNEIPLGDHRRRWPDLEQRVGQGVAVGVRPESFLADPDGALRVEVTDVELVGAEQYVHATLAARPVQVHDVGIGLADVATTTIVAATAADYTVDLWHPVHLGVRIDELHLFEFPSGRSIGRVGGRVATRC